MGSTRRRPFRVRKVQRPHRISGERSHTALSSGRRPSRGRSRARIDRGTSTMDAVVSSDVLARGFPILARDSRAGVRTWDRVRVCHHLGRWTLLGWLWTQSNRHGEPPGESRLLGPFDSDSTGRSQRRGARKSRLGVSNDGPYSAGDRCCRRQSSEPSGGREGRRRSGRHPSAANPAVWRGKGRNDVFADP